MAFFPKTPKGAFAQTAPQHIGLQRVMRARDSPGSNTGRGLKQAQSGAGGVRHGDSPGSNAGRGLKLGVPGVGYGADDDSSGNNAGRGLELAQEQHAGARRVTRPTAMPGVG